LVEFYMGKEGGFLVWLA